MCEDNRVPDDDTDKQQSISKIQFCCDNLKNNRINLFKNALQAAKYGKVLYILRNELTELPQLSQDFNNINRHYMKMISFLYANNLETLIESISTLPDWQNIPSTIVIDELNEYCPKGKLQQACGTVAFLIDTIRSCSKALNTSYKLFISINKDAVGSDYCRLLQELYYSELQVIEK